ncbi:MAG: hypothetical protein E7311_02990 [Clostridiales bacterium]|nr:hypothetical protein [Clostridiales bacterium]
MSKILRILIVSIVLLNIAFISVFAFNVGAYEPTDPLDGDLAAIGGKIIYVFQRVGTFFAVGVLTYIGIQFMIASPSEKADIKGRAVPYLVGAVMVFAIVNLLQIVYNFLN